MKFKEWLYFEGKAMNVSEDMMLRSEAELERPYKNCFIVDIINNFIV